MGCAATLGSGGARKCRRADLSGRDGGAERRAAAQPEGERYGSDGSGSGGGPERRVLGNSSAAGDDVYWIVLREDRQRRSSGDREPGERSDGRGCGPGHGGGSGRRLEAIHVYAEDRKGPGDGDQSPVADDFTAGDGVVQPGFAVSADVPGAALWEPDRPDGEA